MVFLWSVCLLDFHHQYRVFSSALFFGPLGWMGFASLVIEPPPVLLPLPERVRTSRAVMALEHSTAPETESLLNALSGGAPDAPLTREAKSALDRVRQRLSK